MSIIPTNFGSIFFTLKSICLNYKIFFFQIFFRSPFPSEISQIPIKAIAKSSVINSSSGEITKALLRIVIHLSVFQAIVYAHHRFLKTSELFHIIEFDFSKYFIDSSILSLDKRINHFK